MSHKNLLIVPYCYFIGWPELNKFYYGVKFGTGANPKTFWKTYFTSSELVSQYRQQYGEPSIIKVRKIFNPAVYGSLDNAQLAATLHENTVIRRMNMVPEERFLNCSNNVCHRTGERMTNHTKYRIEKFGQYHSIEGLESMREFNKIYSKLNNPMNRPEVKEKHLDAIAQKIGYPSHLEYLNTIKFAFEKYKTIKTTAEKTGHAQYTIRHLLINNFGKDWVEKVRKVGLVEARARQKERIPLRKKVIKDGELNPNAYVWEAKSPTGEVIVVKGNRLDFCKQQGIGTSLDTQKPHLRGFWEFKKLCKVKDYMA
jgi:hypothetical protein